MLTLYWTRLFHLILQNVMNKMNSLHIMLLQCISEKYEKTLASQTKMTHHLKEVLHTNSRVKLWPI